MSDAVDRAMNNNNNNNHNNLAPPVLAFSAAQINIKGLSFLHNNSTDLAAFLANSAAALGRNDLSLPLSKLSGHWIDNVGDLRLLYSEGILRELGLPIRLVLWIEEQLIALENNNNSNIQLQAVPYVPACHQITPPLPLVDFSLAPAANNSIEEEYVNETSDVLMNSDLPAAGDSRGLSFEYSGVDFDAAGIVHYLATAALTRAWSNPMTSGLVNVSASSVLSDSHPLSAVVGTNVVRCVTKAEQNSWIMIDFINNTVRPSHYSLRHYSSWDSEALRFWTFEGSNDRVVWQLLREHINDESLNSKGATHTWLIDQAQPSIVNSPQGFRYFRILQTGENSNKHHYLACSGFEIYGKLFQSAAAVAAAADNFSANSSHNLAAIAPQIVDHNPNSTDVVCRYSHDFDGHGILSYLATNGFTSPWVNPSTAEIISLSASSLAEDSQPLFNLVGNAVVRLVTRAEPNSWFQIDFLERSVCPTAYTLRHYSSWDTEALRNWRFLGSNDGETWVLLSEHREDEALKLRGQSATWQFSPGAVQNKFFRIFRIFQYGLNSNKHHYLACSGLEIYGTVRFGQKGAQNSNNSNNSANLAANSVLPAFNPPIPRPISRPPSISLPSQQVFPVENVASPLLWESSAAGNFLQVLGAGNIVKNTGSNDKWQLIRGKTLYSEGIHQVSIRILADPATSNTWRFLLGCVPASLDCKLGKQWVGTNGSWGYIAGTGGKCHEKAVSLNYGAKFGLNDIITITLNFSQHTIEFTKNSEYQGIAFENLNCPVYIAASLTAVDSQLQLLNSTESQALLSAAHLSPAIPLNNLPNLSLHHWDPTLKSNFLTVDNSAVHGVVSNTGSNDKWQSARSIMIFSADLAAAMNKPGLIQEFSIEILGSPASPNSWRLIVGVVPASFTCTGNKQWVGASESWGYIAGTGGKCFNQPKSILYGESFGSVGDRITVRMDWSKGTIEFLKNGKSQGIAFNNLVGPVHAAVSLTATGAAARLIVH
jgi:hypothetical protein